MGVFKANLVRRAAKYTDMEITKRMLKSGLDFNHALELHDRPFRALFFAAATLYLYLHLYSFWVLANGVYGGLNCKEIEVICVCVYLIQRDINLAAKWTVKWREGVDEQSNRGPATMGRPNSSSSRILIWIQRNDVVDFKVLL